MLACSVPVCRLVRRQYSSINVLCDSFTLAKEAIDPLVCRSYRIKQILTSLGVFTVNDKVFIVFVERF